MDSIDYLGRGVLHVVACTQGAEEVTNFLCQQNIHLDLLDNRARSALYLAIEANNFGVAEILAAHGASIIADGSRMSKVLCEIGFDNDLKKLRFLVKCDVDINQSDYDKRNVGHLAACEDNLKLLEYLATHSKFDFNLKDRWNNSTLD